MKTNKTLKSLARSDRTERNGVWQASNSETGLAGGSKGTERMRGVGKGYRVSCALAMGIAGACLFSTDHATATVFEYDSEGKLTVTETPQLREANIATNSATPDALNRAELRELARTVALRFSGEPGVRKAGLSALTFIDVFEALVAAESNFDPEAVSPKGAQGLGQLMPGTAKDLGVRNPFDPLQNLTGSAQYLSAMLLEFGSLDLALAAYNAGPERVKEHHGIPPFTETQSYVANVLNAAGVSLPTPAPTAAQPASVPINKEQPLTGETSVWEF